MHEPNMKIMIIILSIKFSPFPPALIAIFEKLGRSYSTAIVANILSDITAPAAPSIMNASPYT